MAEMAALRPMLAIAKEETAAITAELASASRVAVETSASGAAGIGRVGVEMNPLAVRQAVEVGSKEGGALGMRLTREGAEGTTLLSRQAVEATIKDGTGESLLSQHLSLNPSQSTLVESLLSSYPNPTSTQTFLHRLPNPTSGQSIITQTIEQDLGQTLKEVLSNAGQTGVEEQMDQVAPVVKVLAALTECIRAGGEWGYVRGHVDSSG